MSGIIETRQIVPIIAAAIVFGAGFGAGRLAQSPRVERVFAATAAADDSFAACTAAMSDGVEGLFLLDFETGDLTGGVLNRGTATFATTYRSNVLEDLGFKPGKVKGPRFLLTSGLADFGGTAGNTMAGSVLYVTDALTGVTVAYGIPWNAQQAAGGAPTTSQFVPLDKATPRGGKMK